MVYRYAYVSDVTLFHFQGVLEAATVARGLQYYMC